MPARSMAPSELTVESYAKAGNETRANEQFGSVGQYGTAPRSAELGVT